MAIYPLIYTKPSEISEFALENSGKIRLIAPGPKEADTWREHDYRGFFLSESDPETMSSFIRSTLKEINSSVEVTNKSFSYSGARRSLVPKVSGRP